MIRRDVEVVLHQLAERRTDAPPIDEVLLTLWTAAFDRIGLAEGLDLVSHLEALDHWPKPADAHRIRHELAVRREMDRARAALDNANVTRAFGKKPA